MLTLTSPNHFFASPPISERVNHDIVLLYTPGAKIGSPLLIQAENFWDFQLFAREKKKVHVKIFKIASKSGRENLILHVKKIPKDTREN